MLAAWQIFPTRRGDKTTINLISKLNELRILYISYLSMLESSSAPAAVAAIHSKCVQQMALQCGRAHFKCPVCSDREKFLKYAILMGVYVPEQASSSSSFITLNIFVTLNICPQDASWEREMRKASTISPQWVSMRAQGMTMHASFNNSTFLRATTPTLRCPRLSVPQGSGAPHGRY